MLDNRWLVGIVRTMRLAEADGDRHVAEHRRAAGSSYREKVRETWHLQPQIGAWSGRPGVVQAQAVTAHDAHPQQRAGHCVEAGCEYDDVEFVFPIPRLDALRRDPLDRFCPMIGRAHV